MDQEKSLVGIFFPVSANEPVVFCYLWHFWIVTWWIISGLFALCSGIVDYMSDQAGPPSKQIQSVKQIQELIKDGDDAIIVGVFSSEGDAALDVYMEAC